MTEQELDQLDQMGILIGMKFLNTPYYKHVDYRVIKISGVFRSLDKRITAFQVIEEGLSGSSILYSINLESFLINCFYLKEEGGHD